jgi:hypothetical protein
MGIFIKICQETPNFAKIRQKIKHFTPRPKYTVLLLVIQDRHTSTLFKLNGTSLFVCPSVHTYQYGSQQTTSLKSNVLLNAVQKIHI